MKGVHPPWKIPPPQENVPATPVALAPTLCHNNTYSGTASSNGGRPRGAYAPLVELQGGQSPPWLHPSIEKVCLFLSGVQCEKLFLDGKVRIS